MNMPLNEHHGRWCCISSIPKGVFRIIQALLIYTILQGHHNSVSTSEKFYLSLIPRRKDFQVRLETADLHHFFISKEKNNYLPRTQGAAKKKKYKT